jgi:hypothetical protein
MIEQRFHVRLDFEYPARSDSDKIEDALFAAAAGRHLEIFGGNAACSPYLHSEVATLAIAQDLEASLTQVLKKHRCKDIK